LTFPHHPHLDSTSLPHRPYSLRRQGKPYLTFLALIPTWQPSAGVITFAANIGSGSIS
jgi:hypothetical protein